MSGAMPTLVRREFKFPPLLPTPPQPHPLPLPKRRGLRVYGNLNQVRDLHREMDDLSDEENELEDLNMSVHNYGESFLIPIGRTLTQLEEKNDAEEDDDGEDEGEEEYQSNGIPSPGEDEGEMDPEEEEGVDLDASMEDLDEDPLGADMTEETFDLDAEGDITEDLEEQPNGFLSD
ncbi:hypothetical protein D9611_004918 [Ephemerocybe angulata]|uniref:Uncharacterized protein n=2 Tax=Ephemerocybe angulata TaxID=980116 RepID=A0A8H6IF86_9AGAR|nr:hypothetical protein D9611_004918 [Tulosesus angulatus]KAF6763914.1 hypothetical protein DFP72DRAFT_487062 [Tulosesus angulatus]